MTLIEAVATGLRIKRKSWILFIDWPDNTLERLYKTDILADDWEVEKPQKKKVKLYLYSFKSLTWFTTTQFYKNDEEFLKDYLDVEQFMKNENNFIEVEEE